MHTAGDSSSGFRPKDTAKTQYLGVARIVLLSVWAVASFGTCYFARELQGGESGRPLAYAVAGQGLLILFILIVVVNAAIFRDDGTGEELAGEEAGAGG